MSICMKSSKRVGSVPVSTARGGDSVGSTPQEPDSVVCRSTPYMIATIVMDGGVGVVVCEVRGRWTAVRERCERDREGRVQFTDCTRSLGTATDAFLAWLLAAPPYPSSSSTASHFMAGFFHVRSWPMHAFTILVQGSSFLHTQDRPSTPREHKNQFRERVVRTQGVRQLRYTG